MKNRWFFDSWLFGLLFFFVFFFRSGAPWANPGDCRFYFGVPAPPRRPLRSPFWTLWRPIGDLWGALGRSRGRLGVPGPPLWMLCAAGSASPRSLWPPLGALGRPRRPSGISFDSLCLPVGVPGVAREAPWPLSGPHRVFLHGRISSPGEGIAGAGIIRRRDSTNWGVYTT